MLTKEELNDYCYNHCDLYEMCAVPVCFDVMDEITRMEECQNMRKYHFWIDEFIDKFEQEEGRDA